MDPVSQQQYAAWAAALRASDRQAFTALYDVLHPALFRYVWTLTQHEEVSYDIVQEAFVKLWQMRGRLDPERSVKALLFRIARNLAYQHHHRRRHEDRAREAWTEEMPSEAPPDVALAAQDLSAHLAAWIAEMPPRRREVFELSRLRHLSHHEIATVLDLSPKTVNNHIVEALRHLRTCLSAYDAAYERHGT